MIALIVVWGLLFAAEMPIRQAYLNGMIPSQQRATILSFDSLMGSTGGVWAQPVLGRAADVWGYAPSYLLSAGISALALPFIWLSRRAERPGRHDDRHARDRTRRRGARRGRARARLGLPLVALARRLTISSSSLTTSGSRSVVDVAELAALGDVAQQAAHDLPRAGLRQVVGPDDPLRARELADPLGDVLADLGDQLVGRPRGRPRG